MKEGSLHVNAVMRAAIDNECGDEIDDKCDPGNPDHGPAFDRLRRGETVDRLNDQIESDDQQGRQIDERGDDFSLGVAEGHQLVRRPPAYAPRKPCKTKRGRIAEVVQCIRDKRQ